MGSFFYSTPPLKLEASGYGELTASIIVAFLVPSFAFVLQTGEIHRLIPMTTFPLVILHMGMLIAFEMPDYASDFKSGKRTILVRMGSDNGILLHNILILTSYLLLGIAAIFGLPLFVWIPVFFTIPLGIFLIWYMNRIAQGMKPNWTTLTVGELSLFGIVTYLIMFAYWIN